MRSGYKYEKYVYKSENEIFDKIHTPGTKAPASGIYHCEGCGHAYACNQGDPLPPQNTHQHGPQDGEIRWRLTIWA